MKQTRQDFILANSGDVFHYSNVYSTQCSWFEFKLLNRTASNKQLWHAKVIACDCNVMKSCIHIGGKIKIKLGKTLSAIVLVRKAISDKHPLLQLCEILQHIEKEQ